MGYGPSLARFNFDTPVPFCSHAVDGFWGTQNTCRVPLLVVSMVPKLNELGGWLWGPYSIPPSALESFPLFINPHTLSRKLVWIASSFRADLGGLDGGGMVILLRAQVWFTVYLRLSGLALPSLSPQTLNAPKRPKRSRSSRHGLLSA